MSAVLVTGLTVPTTAAAEGGSPGGWLRAPASQVNGGHEQLSLTGADAGAEVDLYQWSFRHWRLRLEEAGSATADDYGSVLFRDVDPGLYLVRAEGDGIHWASWVRDADGRHPRQWFYDRQELEPGLQYIETRDGTTLSANVVLPGPVEDGPYPTVVEYSGYDPSNPTGAVPAQPGSLIASTLGYAVVGVNVRGTGCSGGAYDFFETMQVLDGYDVIETVAAQEWVLGNEVGMVGLSYPGISQLFVAQSRPPSLAAITPLSVYGDTATGVLSPGGLLNTGFATSWADQVLRNAEPYGTGWVNQVIDGGDTACDANQQLRLQNVDATAKARANPFYTDEVAGPLDIRTFVGDIDVPVFMAAAFQDEQTGPSFGDLLGEFDSSPSVRATIYNGLHADGFAPQVLAEWIYFLDLYVRKEIPSIPPVAALVAPVLSQSTFGGNVPLPADRFTDVTSYAEALARWEGEDEIRILHESGTGAENGLPVAGWETSSPVWPLAETVPTRWWLGAEGTLADAATDAAGTGVAFHPNPAVASTHFHAGGSIWNKNPNWNWVPQAEGENARFQTEPLGDDVTMTGTASVDLWLKSTATDAELEVVLSEITPDGNEVRVQAGQLQASYRGLHPSSTALQPVQYGYEADFAPLVPDQWTEARVQIPVFSHTFRAGSSVRLTVNTPGGDTARWEFELDGPGAEATHLIGTGTDHPSSIVVPVIPGGTAPTPLPACNALRGQPCRTAPEIVNDIEPDPEPQPEPEPEPLPTTINEDRPAAVTVPASYDPETAYPLIILLHGFGANGAVQSAYLGIGAQVDEREFVLVTPNGTENANGSRYWNAIPKCCGGGVDDVAYVTQLIADAKEAFSIDPERVYLVGHSNGAMMSFTMACAASEEVTAIVSLAGSSFDTDEECTPATEPVSALMIHGDADGTVNYGEGFFASSDTVRDRHAGLLGCDLAAMETGDPIDLLGGIDGPETMVERHVAGCAEGTSIERWTMQGGSHIPFPWTEAFAPGVLDWLLAKTK